MSLLVLCPTKGRPEAVQETYRSFIGTKVLPTTSIRFVVNDDEEVGGWAVPHLVVPRREWMNEVLQSAVDQVLAQEDPSILGFIGDDNRFRTPGWDIAVERALERGGFAYGNDLGRNDIPVHVFISTPIVRALGWYGLPEARHLYLDNVWGTLGRGARCLYFLREVVIEHLHPSWGKAEVDASYAETNSPAMYEHDRAVFERWLATRAAQDIEIVRGTLAS